MKYKNPEVLKMWLDDHIELLEEEAQYHAKQGCGYSIVNYISPVLHDLKLIRSDIDILEGLKESIREYRKKCGTCDNCNLEALDKMTGGVKF